MCIRDRPKIKWVNDIYLNGKKICGILTEAESNFETGTISRLIIGIGINCYEQVFPDDIAEKAAYITASSGAFSRNQLAASITSKFFRLLETFDRRTILREYRSRSMILGQPVTLYGTAYGALPENGGRGIKAVSYTHLGETISTSIRAEMPRWRKACLSASNVYWSGTIIRALPAI